MDITRHYTEDELAVFRAMVESQWQVVDSFHIEKQGQLAPPPILATEGGLVVGGASFTWHDKPDKSGMGLWVNTVYVDPRFRKQGIASALLAAATELLDLGHGLYAYTDTAALYEKSGWIAVAHHDAQTVFEYRRRQGDAKSE